MVYILVWSSAEAMDLEISQGKADEKRGEHRGQGHDSILADGNHSKSVSTDSI